MIIKKEEGKWYIECFDASEKKSKSLTNPFDNLDKKSLSSKVLPTLTDFYNKNKKGKEKAVRFELDEKSGKITSKTLEPNSEKKDYSSFFNRSRMNNY